MSSSGPDRPYRRLKASKRSSSAACCPLCPGTTTPRFAPIRGESFVPPSNPQAGLAVRTPDWRRCATNFVRQNPSPDFVSSGVLATILKPDWLSETPDWRLPKRERMPNPSPDSVSSGVWHTDPHAGSAVRRRKNDSARLNRDFWDGFSLKPGGCPTQDQRFCEAGTIFSMV